MKGILGRKLGMTSIFEADGRQTACTIIEAGPCVVTQVKTPETDGYHALQIAFGERKEKNTPRPLKQHFAKANTSPKRYIREIRDPDIQKQVRRTDYMRYLSGRRNRECYWHLQRKRISGRGETPSFSWRW